MPRYAEQEHAWHAKEHNGAPRPLNWDDLRYFLEAALGAVLFDKSRNITRRCKAMR
ncbi:hypothetical protein IHE31_00885 (plasmid) [Mycetohabitans rhizoxinica]